MSVPVSNLQQDFVAFSPWANLRKCRIKLSALETGKLCHLHMYLCRRHTAENAGAALAVPRVCTKIGTFYIFAKSENWKILRNLVFENIYVLMKMFAVFIFCVNLGNLGQFLQLFFTVSNFVHQSFGTWESFFGKFCGLEI